jgi:hypothetical protein
LAHFGAQLRFVDKEIRKPDPFGRLLLDIDKRYAGLAQLKPSQGSRNPPTATNLPESQLSLFDRNWGFRNSDPHAQDF